MGAQLATQIRGPLQNSPAAAWWPANCFICQAEGTTDAPPSSTSFADSASPPAPPLINTNNHFLSLNDHIIINSVA